MTTNPTVALVRFNSQAFAERTLQILQGKGLNPNLVFGQTDDISGAPQDISDHDWIILEVPAHEADSATAVLDSILEEIDEDEEEELSLGQTWERHARNASAAASGHEAYPRRVNVR